MNEAVNWYVARGKQKFGPCSLTQLRQMAVTGQVQPSDMVLPPGTTKWVPLSTFPHFFQPLSAAPKPNSPNLFDKLVKAWQGWTKPIRIAVVAGALLPFFCCTCMVPVMMLGQKGGGDRSVRSERDNSITADYLPFKQDAVAEYDVQMYIGEGKGTFGQRKSKRFAEKDEIWESTKWNYALDGSGKEIYKNYSGTNTFLTIHKYHKDSSYVWITSTDKDSGIESTDSKLKIGAKVGDTWEVKPIPSITNVYSVVRFERYMVPFNQKERPCVVIRNVMRIEGKEVFEMEMEDTFVKGIGFQQRISRMNGEVKSKIVLEDKAGKRLTTAEKAFLE